MTDGDASLRVLSAKDIDAVLAELSDTEILDCIRTALVAFSAAQKNEDPSSVQNVQSPQRISTQTPHHSILYMPSRLGQLDTTSIKIVAVPTSSEDKAGLPASTLLIDEMTGRVQAMMNATCLTAVRTAAASALALRLSPHIKSASRLLVFGSGLQAFWHAKLVANLCPVLENVTIANRSINARTERTVAQLRNHFREQGRYLTIRCCTNEDAVREYVSIADVICCCTPSTEPLFSAHQLKRTASISLIGSYKPNMREVDLVPLFRPDEDGTVASRIIVDSKEACLGEAGELHHLRTTIPTFPLDKIVKLGSLLSQVREGTIAQTAEEEVTVFKCVGFGALDSAISALVLGKAKDLCIGTLVPF